MTLGCFEEMNWNVLNLYIGSMHKSFHSIGHFQSSLKMLQMHFNIESHFKLVCNTVEYFETGKYLTGMVKLQNNPSENEFSMFEPKFKPGLGAFNLVLGC